jgi:hypothetical protein
VPSPPLDPKLRINRRHGVGEVPGTEVSSRIDSEPQPFPSSAGERVGRCLPPRTCEGGVKGAPESDLHWRSAATLMADLTRNMNELPSVLAISYTSSLSFQDTPPRSNAKCPICDLRWSSDRPPRGSVATDDRLAVGRELESVAQSSEARYREARALFRLPPELNDIVTRPIRNEIPRYPASNDRVRPLLRPCRGLEALLARDGIR